MKFARRAEGKEVIPNVTFWSELPGTIKVVYYKFTCFWRVQKAFLATETTQDGAPGAGMGNVW